jgi:hypothetical protein
MITIEQEAEEYKQHLISLEGNKITAIFGRNGFIAGHNSKATQAKVLQAQIDVLKKHRNNETMYWLDKSIDNLEQQLKELE